MSGGSPRPPRGSRRKWGDTSRIYSAYQEGQEGEEAYEADREMVAGMRALGLEPPLIARNNRRFHERAVAHVVDDLGISGILEIGCGQPQVQVPNTHEIAQSLNALARVVYVDNDLLVERQAAVFQRNGTEEGSTAFVLADVREPEDIEEILAVAREQLDFSRPVALFLVAVLHFVEDDDDPQGVVDALVGALPEGSVVVISHMIDDHQPEVMRQAEGLYRDRGHPARIRRSDAVVGFLADLDLDSTGFVPVHQWRQPDEEVAAIDASKVPCRGGVFHVRQAARPSARG